MELKNKTIVFLGDSITEGVGSSEDSKSYVGRVANHYQHTTVYNFGVSGTRISNQKVTYLKEEWDYNFIDRAEIMPDADLVGVFGGTNDYGHGDAPLGTFEDRTRDTFYGALHVLCVNLLKKYMGKKIFIATPLHRNDELTANFDGKILKDYAVAIREVAEFYGIPVLDLYKDCPIQPVVPEICEKYMPDGVHPSDEGYQLVAEEFIKFIDRL